MKLLLNCFCDGPKLLMRFWLFDSALLHMHMCTYTHIYTHTYVCMCVCVVYTCVVCAYPPLFEHRNSAKNEEQFSGSFVFCPSKLPTKVRQFVSSFRSSLEEVYRKLPLAVSLSVDFKVNF